ncbi:MAG: large conductance mechanosensitive channel protein MscL [Clostridia bacterium]|nr:large conductance mechanosensitive channel protein MscL [Clostridia bacterium]
MKKFLNEFKEFALKGSIVDLAIGMIIGTAFTGIVTAFTANFIQPILDLVTFAHKGLYEWSEIAGFISAFISAIINFVIIALVLFLLLKGINKLTAMKKKEEEEAPTVTTKVCPFCKTEIDLEATRCPNCTSELE